ncbi:MAG TPA: tetratricopeptide repeat protein [Bryobacteraceae bacterium]|nr:tetratricopeptide repeat protein [Bryobacteraceae bacterium]
MARALLIAFLLGVTLHAQESQLPPPPPPRPQDLPEEDEALKPKEYPLNPLESAKNLNVGNQYMKKGNYRAAANRYKEATLWDPGSAEAFERLGEALEHVHDFVPAREAYTKYLDLAKDAKDADAIRRRIAKWPKASASKTLPPNNDR